MRIFMYCLKKTLSYLPNNMQLNVKYHTPAHSFISHFVYKQYNFWNSSEVCRPLNLIPGSRHPVRNAKGLFFSKLNDFPRRITLSGN